MFPPAVRSPRASLGGHRPQPKNPGFICREFAPPLILRTRRPWCTFVKFRARVLESGSSSFFYRTDPIYGVGTRVTQAVLRSYRHLPLGCRPLGRAQLPSPVCFWVWGYTRPGEGLTLVGLQPALLRCGAAPCSFVLSPGGSRDPALFLCVFFCPWQTASWELPASPRGLRAGGPGLYVHGSRVSKGSLPRPHPWCCRTTRGHGHSQGG